MRFLKRQTAFSPACSPALRLPGFTTTTHTAPILDLHTAWEAMTYTTTNYNGLI